jgi:hypothetical protein
MEKLRTNSRLHLSIAVALFLGLVISAGEAMPELRAQSGVESTGQGGNEEEKQLLTVVRDERLRQTEPDRVVQAIKRLGEVKSTNAINELIHLLTFKRIFESERLGVEGAEDIRLITASERYPAVGALIEIGEPSLSALVDVIETYDSNSLEGSNAWQAVMIIFRDAPSSAVEYLRKAGAKASSTAAKQRLSYAADKASDLAKKLTRE